MSVWRLPSGMKVIGWALIALAISGCLPPSTTPNYSTPFVVTWNDAGGHFQGTQPETRVPILFTRLPTQTPTRVPTATPSQSATATSTRVPNTATPTATRAATAGQTAVPTPGQVAVSLLWPPPPETGIINRAPQLRWRLLGSLTLDYNYNTSSYCPSALWAWERGPTTIQVWPSGAPSALIVDYNGELNGQRDPRNEFVFLAGNLSIHPAGRYDWRVIMRCHYGPPQYEGERWRYQAQPVTESVAYGSFWFDPSADVTPTPFQSPTPLPTPTALATWDPFVSSGPLAISNVRFQYAVRDESRSNGAIAYFIVDFIGGAAYYDIYSDDVLAVEDAVPNAGARLWVMFPVLTSCGASAARTVRIMSQDSQAASFSYYLSDIPC
jgi:hypothetical protein